MDGMCPKCGPEPDTTIWDGVTLAFSQKHLQKTLEPPIVLSPQSKICQDVVYIHKQQCIIAKNLRQLVQKVVKGLSPGMMRAVFDTAASGVESNDNLADKASEPQVANVPPALDQETARINATAADYLDSASRAVQQLSTLNRSLGLLFDCWYGLAAIASCQAVPAQYSQLFIQVGIC